MRNVCIEAEIADSPATRERGLMFRQDLSQDEGMLFIFQEEDIRIFWMKNMNFPLDMLWIDSKKKIVDIKENIPPCRMPCGNITPSEKAKYVLEVKAGFVNKNGIKLGDEVKF